MNPHIIFLLVKGHKEKIKEQDYLAWRFNQYTLSAVTVAVERNLAGKKSKARYIEKPFSQEEAIPTQKNIESNEEVAVFEMKQRINALREQGLPESPL